MRDGIQRGGGRVAFERVAITAVYPVVTIVLAMIMFKEAMTVKQVVGMLLSIGGVMLLTVK
ncbi:MAG: EamA family transporter [Acidobacteriota bacterium]|nr:EamA family transporter [Acidobacteriota bacterium]